MEHDEAISYLAATCHQGEWDRMTARGAAPVATWTPAGEWRRFAEPDDALCLGRISRDLADHDIHPPLYFWLLHLWVGAVGVSIASGPALNLLIFAAAALALFGFARRLLREPLSAALVVLVWAVSPAVVPIATEARMYDLLALVSILFSWQVVRLAEAPRLSRRGLAALALASAAGLATVFTFLLVAAATTLLYLAFKTHGLAMGGKYLASAWPFLAFGPVLLVRRVRVGPGVAAAALCVAMLASGLAGALSFHEGDGDPPPYLAGSDRVVADTVRRGVLLPIVFQLSEDEPVFAAPQERLLRERRRWLPALREGDLYVGDTVYGTPADRDAILAELRRRRRAEPAPRGLPGVRTAVFVVGPEARPPDR